MYKTDMNNKMFIKYHISLRNLHYHAIHKLLFSAVKLRKGISEHITYSISLHEI
jgi:hypothetical protein